MNYWDTLIQEVKQLADTLTSEIVLHIPNLVVAILVFIAGLLLARLTRKLIKRFILYLHRGINDKLNNRRLTVDIQGSAKFIATAFFWVIILFTVALITQILEFSFLSKWFDGLINYLPNVIAALVIVFSGLIVSKLISDLIVSVSLRTGLFNGKVLGTITRYVILGISIIVAIDQLGIDIRFITNLVFIVLGALLFGAALAFGLGAKTSVSNILGSYYLQKTFEVGNSVQIGEDIGVITKISTTSVILDTESDQIIIPAKDFNEIKAVIKNSK
jgi:hypothetical protein